MTQLLRVESEGEFGPTAFPRVRQCYWARQPHAIALAKAARTRSRSRWHRVRLEKTGDNDRRQCAGAPAKGCRGRAGLLKPPDSRHLIREAPPIVRGPSIASVGDIRCRRDRPRRCRGRRRGSKRRSMKRSWAPRKEPMSSARMAWAPAWERPAWERGA